MLPRLEDLLDATPENRPRIRDALLGGAGDDAGQTLAEALKRLARWRRALDDAGDRLRAAQAEVVALARLVGAAGDAAVSSDAAAGTTDAAFLEQAMEIAWIAGGSFGDRPQDVDAGLRDGLREAARRLDQSVQAVQRFRHGADAAMVLSRPATDTGVRDAIRLLDAGRRATRVRAVLAEAARRGMMPPTPEGSRRELLVLAAVLVEAGSVRDRELALRYAQQALARLARQAQQRGR